MENENKELNTIEAESQDSAQPVVDGKKVLLRLRDVKQYFPVKKTKLREKQRYVRANDGISLDIFEGETLGLVGESGCGKSTLGRTILQLYPQSHGDILYYKDGKAIDLKKLSYEEMRVLRKDLQLIFQDPLFLPEPPHDRGPDYRRGSYLPRHLQAGRPRHEGVHHEGDGGLRPGQLYVQPLSPPVLRRPAPAHRHCRSLALSPQVRGVRRGRFPPWTCPSSPRF